jgi:hypothetical protein
MPKVKKKIRRFNEAKFLEDVQKIHLKPDELPIYSAISDTEVREKLKKFIIYEENPQLSAALDEICTNLIGRTMFKVLMTKMHANNTLEKKGKIKIIEQINEDEGSRYSSKLFAVKVNFNFYKENGEGLSSRKYFYIDEEGKIKTKLKSLAGSLFHEFCHGLHDVSKTKKSHNILCLEETDFSDAWGDDEELRTITCLAHDPICDHCFDLYQSILKKEDFLPRYSHGGHNGAGEPTKEDLKDFYNCISASQEYMDGWREYML